MAKEDPFFSEVDKQRQSQTKNWTIVISLLIFIFALSIYGLLKIRNAFRNIDFAGWQIQSNIPKFSLGSEIENLSKSSEPEFALDINSLKLSAYLNLSDDSFPLLNTYAKINSDTVVIYGRLKSTRLKLPVSLTMKAEAVSGQVVFSNQSTDTEKIFMPTETQDSIVAGINKRLNFDLNLSGNFTIDSMTQSNNKISLKMIKK